MTCRKNDVILGSRCQQIDFSMLHLYISFKFVTIKKKTHANISILTIFHILMDF